MELKVKLSVDEARALVTWIEMVAPHQVYGPVTTKLRKFIELVEQLKSNDFSVEE